MEASRLHLWEITEAEEALAAKLAAAGGEISPELEAEWDLLQGTFDAKAERVALYIKELEANAASAASERDRLDGIARALTNRAKHLKGYLFHHMTLTQRTKVETHRVTVRIQSNGGKPSFRWTGTVDNVPEAFRRVTVEVNRAAVEEAYKAGSLPDGFVVEPKGTHLRIE